jgi:hypothetical protein
MGRIATVLLCMLLVWGAMCPAFSLQQAGAHSCCHTKGMRTAACCHSGIEQQAPRDCASPAYPIVTEIRWPEPVTGTSLDALFAPAPVDHSPPVLFRILRI